MAGIVLPAARCYLCNYSRIQSVNQYGSRRLTSRSRALANVRCEVSNSDNEFDDGDKDEGRASSRELKLALGIDTDSKSGQNIRSLVQRAAAQKPTPNVYMEKLEQTAEAVRDFTEGDMYQTRGLQFMLLVFPIWLLYVLVAAQVIELPFPLPFLQLE